MTENPLMFLALVLQLIIYFDVSLAIPKSNLTDESALLAFRSHIISESDPSSVIASNWSDATSFCNWVGVTCSDRHKRVVALDLYNLQLKGTIPPHVGNLSFLVFLDLSNNSFHGPLPKELGQLHRLKILNLQQNSFIGEIPSEFGLLTHLQHLILESNSLAGTTPSSLFMNVTRLKTLALNRNFLHGKILEEIGNLSSLQTLRLGFNNFSGDIPRVIFNMSSLQEINLRSNNLSAATLQANLCSRLPKLERLNLGKIRLYGPIPSDLFECTELKLLDLDSNKLAGSIPREIGNLTKLSELYLSGNSLEGEIPQEIWNLVNLQILALEVNNLHGSIPRRIGNLTSLMEINFRENHLTGSIPGEIGNCTMLEEIVLQSNNLTGLIPVEIGNLQNLQMFDVSANNISGRIPSAIFNISNIISLDVSLNHLSGQLPPSLGLWLPNFVEAFLGGNQISGPIPASIGNASQLITLDFASNSFSGIIPDSLGNLRNLQLLNLGGNFLTGKYSSFLSSLTNCESLVNLWLDDNPLDINLPNSIGNLSASLESLYLSTSQLKGSIPKEIGNLSSLIDLDFEDNELTGIIPTTIARLQALQALYLPDNKLQGTVPRQLCQLKELSILHLRGNRLVGSIPECLSNFASLRELDLASNSFTGIIPPTLFTLKDILQLKLSSNSLSGPIPIEIGNLEAVTTIDLSRNQLSGEIPTNIGGLINLINLTLSQNKLQGPIPVSFGDLISLEVLDLSNNSLSGVIPKSMGKLLYLKYFNVSFNQLQGEIPKGGLFANYTARSFMGNEALCGPTQFGVRSCKGKSKKPYVFYLKYVLPTIAAILLLLAIFTLFITYQKKNAKLPLQADVLPLATWRRISYHELELATGGFQETNLLGTGSFGSVYKGTLSDGTNVAVKVFKLQPDGAFTSFDRECEIFCNLRHRNLVKIISSCSNLDFKALVLEFMSNWSLEKWLYSHNYFLDILQRLNIMIDVATALEYLHHGYSTPVVHCDLKPSNVLLDEHMIAHVSDFGIAKLLGEGNSMIQTMTLATIGYMAPEYGSEGIVSIKGDIYSYGILLMETFTRKKPTDEMFIGEMSLRHWIKQSLANQVTQVADANLLNEDDQHFSAKKDCISSILELALQCSEDVSGKRTDIRDVVACLKKIKTKCYFP